VPVLFEVLLRLERRHAARSGRGNGLAVAAVLHVAAGKHAGNNAPLCVVKHVAGGLDVAVLVQIHLPGKHLRIRLVADAEEQAADGQLECSPSSHPSAQPLHVLLFHAQHLFHGGVGAQLDVGMGHGAVQHDLGRAEGLTPVQQRDLAGKAGEKQRLFHGRVAAAHHGNLLAAEEEAVAGGAA
jgi:hypothetical protein